MTIVNKIHIRWGGFVPFGGRTWKKVQLQGAFLLPWKKRLRFTEPVQINEIIKKTAFIWYVLRMPSFIPRDHVGTVTRVAYCVCRSVVYFSSYFFFFFIHTFIFTGSVKRSRFSYWRRKAPWSWTFSSSLSKGHKTSSSFGYYNLQFFILQLQFVFGVCNTIILIYVSKDIWGRGHILGLTQG